MEQDRLSPGQKGERETQRKEKERKMEAERKDEAEGTEGYISEQLPIIHSAIGGCLCCTLYSCTMYIVHTIIS